MIVCVNGEYKEGTLTQEQIDECEKYNRNLPPLTTEQQTFAFARSLAMTATTMTDAQALSMPDILPTWAELLERGDKIAEGVCLMKEGQCYRVVQEVTPIESQPPGADGMLAVYRPVDKKHAGTLEDPIPWVSGMDCKEGKYYSHKGKIYLCTGDMSPCVWEPGEGAPQWEEVA